MCERDRTAGDGETKQKIKVLIVDDYRLMRDVLRTKIEAEDDMMAIAEAADGIKAVRLTEETSPDIILMDINMPKMDGITATRKIMATNNHVRIIGFSMHNYEVARQGMLQAGAVAYYTKTADFKILLDTIRKEVA